jgi:hypothetical protein
VLNLELLDTLLKLIGAIAGVGGGLVAIVYVTFKFLATKWIDNRFATSLEAFRHKHQEEIERLRFQINTQFDRMTKLHQYEFNVLPQIWSLLNDAYRGSLVLTSSLREYPDLDNMAEAQFFEFVEACRLPSWQKKELKDTDRKNNYYVKKIFWLELHDAKQLSDKFHDYMMKNSIFMSEEISDRFHAMDDLIRRTIIEQDTYRRTQQPVSAKEAERLGSQGPRMLNELKSIVQKRLWTEGVSGPDHSV